MAGVNNDDVHVTEMMALSSGDKTDRTVNEIGNYDVGSDEYIPPTQHATPPRQQAAPPRQQAAPPRQQAAPPRQHASLPSHHSTPPIIYASSPIIHAHPPIMHVPPLIQARSRNYNARLKRLVVTLLIICAAIVIIPVVTDYLTENTTSTSKTQVKTECASRPCKNNGLCFEKVNGYTCTCQQGYAGINCDIQIRSECASEPCKNGGSCRDYSYGYTCTCRKGYTGKYCEPACPLVNLTGWVKYGSSCYFFSGNKGDIIEAMTQCNISGGYLANIETGAENSFLLQQVKTSTENQYYIGLNDIEQELNYSWFGTNRLLSQTGYSQWKINEPNDRWGNEDCVVMEYDGYWNDVMCDGSYRYICEMTY